MFNKIRYIILVTIFIFLASVNEVKSAFSFSISSPSATLITSGSQEIDIAINITDLPSESYFRVSLQKETGGSYYGYIQNNNAEWAKILVLSGDCLSYFKVTDLKTSLINIKYKIGDDLLLDNGNYLLKAHRFTKTCTSYTEGLNTIGLVVNLPTPTPNPTVVPTQEPTKSPSPTFISTSKPIPTITSTPKPTSTPSELPEETVESEPVNLATVPAVEKVLSTPKGLVAGDSTEKKTQLLSIIFVVSGVGFLGYCGYLLYNAKHKNV